MDEMNKMNKMNYNNSIIQDKILDDKTPIINYIFKDPDCGESYDKLPNEKKSIILKKTSQYICKLVKNETTNLQEKSNNPPNKSGINAKFFQYNDKQAMVPDYFDIQGQTSTPDSPPQDVSLESAAADQMKINLKQKNKKGRTNELIGKHNNDRSSGGGKRRKKSKSNRRRKSKRKRSKTRRRR